jgi:PadR family transcriptional regulator PadR
MSETQLVKGILEGCILGIIGREELYGYKTVEILNQLGFRVNEATVYPILTRLEIKGCLHVEKRPSPLGPMRKYYSLTIKGRDSLKEFESAWSNISQIVNHILEGRNYEQPQ